MYRHGRTLKICPCSSNICQMRLDFRWLSCVLVCFIWLLFHVNYLKLRKKNCCYKLSKFTTWQLFSLKMVLSEIWVKIIVIFTEKEKQSRKLTPTVRTACFWTHLHFVSYLLNQLRFRTIKHLKMIVWASVLWKMNIHMTKKSCTVFTYMYLATSKV